MQREKDSLFCIILYGENHVPKKVFNNEDEFRIIPNKHVNGNGF
ncbi:hypothetical protein HMPREF1322_1708 [Porphyromonas gingivalis W50]|nr:hypothetical protein PGA7_00005730 [Porphyromonas gingivalis]EIW92951.1 hypothetical protein HMPREF1322_1708 [Porphyromonas gingivalis W50]